MSELKHEVGGKSFKIPLDGFIEATGRDPVKIRQIRVENDLVVAEVMNQRGELLRDEQGSGSACGAGFSLVDGLFPGGLGAGGVNVGSWIGLIVRTAGS